MTSYEVDPNGTIFQIDMAENTPPHRTPYPPGAELPQGAPSELVALVQQLWTPEVVARYQDSLAASLAGP